METVNKDNDVMGQAQNVWAMLDDMAESNPQAYKKFIDKHIKEGKEYMKLPDPHMCVKTSCSNNLKTGEMKKYTLFMNLCEWPRVPKPKDDTSPIPVVGGPLCDLEDKGERCKVVSIAFNPEVLQELGKECKNQEEQQMLVHLGIDFVKDLHKISIPYSYIILDSKTTYKGNLKDLHDGLKLQTKKQDDEYEEEMNQLGATFAPAAQQMMKSDRSLLSQLSNLTVSEEAKKSKSFNERGDSVAEVTLNPNNSKSNKKNLIQEIGSSEINEPDSQKPTYELSMKERSGDKHRRLVVKIELMKVESVSECELDITEVKLKLNVPGKYELDLILPEKINNDTTNAKFSKKSHSLTVTLPTLKS